LLLAAIQRVCQPGPRTEAAAGYRRTILHSLWGFAPERFTSQAFWDCFDRIQAAGSGEDDPDRAQLRLPGLWKRKRLVSQRLPAYDSTNFYTRIAGANTRNQLARRGHDKQGRQLRRTRRALCIGTSKVIYFSLPMIEADIWLMRAE